MAYRICPACGSRFFMAQAGTATQLVFEVDGAGEIQPVAEAERGGVAPAAAEQIRCGACSWRGMLDQLTVSDR